MSELHKQPPLDPKFDPAEIMRREFKEAGEALKEMEVELDDTFVVGLGNFVRTGLPILHGILMDTIPRNTWLVWCDKLNREVKVIDDTSPNQEVIIEIPKLFVDGTVNREDIYSGVESFDNRSGNARSIAGNNRMEYERELYSAITDAYTPGRGDISILDKFNKLFIKYGYQPIEVRNVEGEVVDTANSDFGVNTSSNKADIEYDINDGEEL